MIRKKICLIGTSAVGKTSLVQRFVKGIFSEKYLTTIGVKVDKKVVEMGDETLELIIWDLNGEDRFQKLSMSYLKGMAGYFLVADATRAATLAAAVHLQQKVAANFGALPFLVVVNKDDLKAEQEITPRDVVSLEDQGWRIIRTSAKTGTGVEDAFLHLARQLHSS